MFFQGNHLLKGKWLFFTCKPVGLDPGIHRKSTLRRKIRSGSSNWQSRSLWKGLRRPSPNVKMYLSAVLLSLRRFFYTILPFVTKMPACVPFRLFFKKFFYNFSSWSDFWIGLQWKWKFLKTWEYYVKESSIFFWFDANQKYTQFYRNFLRRELNPNKTDLFSITLGEKFRYNIK